jgi:hypothetical protein
MLLIDILINEHIIYNVKFFSLNLQRSSGGINITVLLIEVPSLNRDE